MAKKKKKKTKKKNINRNTKTNKKKSTKKKTKTVRPKKKTESTNKKKNSKKTTISKKKKINFPLYIVVLLFIILVVFGYYFLYKSPSLTIKSINISEDNYVHVIFKRNKFSFRNKVFCLVEKEDGTNGNWIQVENECSYKLDDIYNVYLKNEDNVIYSVKSNQLGTVNNLSINDYKVYLPVNGTYNYSVTYDKYGNVEDSVVWTSSNEKVATIDNGIAKGIKKGTVTISASIKDKVVTSELIVTDLLVKRPKNGFDFKKKKLKCSVFSKEENDLLDEILKDRINDVGYKTRAAAVEAARFLTLDFPYRINYFYENGRQTTNNVDGEGRYYHVGLYLDKSRYKNITGSKKGPKIWGCSLYSKPARRKMANGLDCSGFVSWALLNAGFNVKDVGAGWSDRKDLTDYGKVKRLTTSLSTSNKIKVGDLLHSERAGGHIGIIVGIDKNYYYVAQALWFGEKGVIITKYKKSKLKNDFPHVVLMDKYYKEDGKLTNMW